MTDFEEKPTFEEKLLSNKEAELVEFKSACQFMDLDKDSDHEITIHVKGPSAVPFWHDDLKAAAAIDLINQIDLKNFEGLSDDYYCELVEAVEESIKWLREP